MSRLPSDLDLGPLPQVDPRHVLQRASIDALTRRLPVSEYLFRDERVDDYGVDGTLELLISGQATNMRAQAQLKARSGTKENADGSVSVSVETANLNYLLNGTCPIYVLYRPEPDEVRFAFAREEWARIAHDTPDWRTQGTVVVRFAHVLNESTLGVLRDAIVAAATFQRGLLERIVVLANGLSSVVNIDPATLEVGDTEQLARLLREQGFALVSNGDARMVAERGRLLPEAALRREPVLRLILGFAEYSRGQYLEADAYTRKLMVGDTSTLSAEDRGFASYLLNSIDYVTGRTNREQFLRSAEEWSANAPQNLAVQYEVIRLWERYMETFLGRDPAGRERVMRELRAALKVASGASSVAIREQAELKGLLLDAHDLTSEYVDAQTRVNGLVPGSGGRRDAEALEEVRSRWGDWKKRVAGLCGACLARGSLYVLCEAQTLLCHAELIVERHEALMREARGGAAQAFPPHIEVKLREMLELARALESVELELRAQFDLAVLADTTGRKAEAERLANDVRVKASFCRDAALERHAAELLSGEDSFSARLEHVRRMRDYGPDEMLLAADDAQLRAMAYETCTMLGIPVSRAEHVLSSVMAEKELAVRKRVWCRWLTLLEEDQGGPETLFANPTRKRVHCARFGTASVVPHEDAHALVRAFEQAHCASCTARSPGAGVPVPAPNEG